MASVWVYKADGTIQCEAGEGISLEKMQDQLNKVIGKENILLSEKRKLPLFIADLCGAPTGSVNAYKITKEGAYLLFKGFPGPMGFALWIWGEPSGEGLSRGFVLGEHKLSGDGDPFPVSLIQGADPGDASAIFLNFIASLSQSGAQPTLISELIGRRCRCYKQGDMLTRDYMPMRVNVELDESNVIGKVWFG